MKKVLVIGATSGTGRSVAYELAKKQVDAVLVSRDLSRLGILAEDIRKLSPKSFFSTVCFDMRNTQDIASWVKDSDVFSDVDSLVYCVGDGCLKKFKDLSYEDHLNSMKLCYFSFVELLRCLLNKRIDKKVQFNAVAISSVASTNSNAKYFCPYVAAKSALEGAVRVLSSELIAKNCSVSAVKPGFIDTPRNEQYKLMHEDVNGFLKKSGYQPGGMLSPDSVARLITFILESQDMSFAGDIIPITAGALS